jgi:hypothetical protein
MQTDLPLDWFGFPADAPKDPAEWIVHDRRADVALRAPIPCSDDASARGHTTRPAISRHVAIQMSSCCFTNAITWSKSSMR